MAVGYRSAGPAPSREDERVRVNEPTVPTVKVDVATLIQREVQIPAPDEEWHSVARFWYDSLAESAQCVYYEPSDWAVAYDEEQKKSITAVVPLKGADLTAFFKGCTNLLVTEVDRRRAGIEVVRAVQLADLEALDESDDNVVSFEEALEASVGN